MRIKYPWQKGTTPNALSPMKDACRIAASKEASRGNGIERYTNLSCSFSKNGRTTTPSVPLARNAEIQEDAGKKATACNCSVAPAKRVGCRTFQSSTFARSSNLFATATCGFTCTNSHVSDVACCLAKLITLLSCLRPVNRHQEHSRVRPPLRLCGYRAVVDALFFFTAMEFVASTFIAIWSTTGYRRQHERQFCFIRGS